MIRQRTLKNIIRASGAGLQSGEKIVLTLRPAPADTGIVLRRMDVGRPVEIPASVENVVRTAPSMVLGRDGAEVAAVEHMLSACAGLGIDNAIIELSAAELPVMDGSAAPFVFLIQSAGIQEQDAPRKYLRVRKAVRVEEGGKWAKLEPFTGFKVTFRVDLPDRDGPGRGRELCVDFSRTSFIKEISRARRHAGTVAERSGSRYEDEYLKHRILAATGDLKLLRHGVIGAYSARQSGHALNHRLMRTLLKDEDAWEILTFGEAGMTPRQAALCDALGG
ncbi:MAG TPA: UDP-3-O-acyl-N-acetylglucosamine deacetylase [Chromatiales bacterium]|nr:UDP-3-O-acyl-N-acetylglucosamine deacetylase [Chromatiales bacterium]